PIPRQGRGRCHWDVLRAGDEYRGHLHGGRTPGGTRNDYPEVRALFWTSPSALGVASSAAGAASSPFAAARALRLRATAATAVAAAASRIETAAAPLRQPRCGGWPRSSLCAGERRASASLGGPGVC